MFSLIDSHAHVQFPAYDADRGEVMARAREAGIGVINIGTQFSTSEDAVRLAGQYSDGVWATRGFHPNHADLGFPPRSVGTLGKSWEQFDYQKFIELARNPKVVAIGECGLDYYRGGMGQGTRDSVKKRQEDIFIQQIELAKEIKKPLVIHCREAFSDLIGILSSLISNFSSPGVVHFFSGSWEDAEKLLNLGFYLSFGGVITFSRDYDAVIKKNSAGEIAA